ncbi:MAG TPA: coenzyme F420-0:L-glutamate ligase [Candidatus Bathyarchaeia archaeon]|nr:coenzyme F420-0:L-glutamate ligase [Candidatus Bathyarchaeia archaeon]
MVKYYALAITTKYWTPREDYVDEIIKALGKRVDDGDFVVVSEKALSTALNNIIDESHVRPSLNAKLISRVWMRFVWGYFLGVMCHFGQRLLQRLREYPLDAGSRHKQVALQHAGLLQALMFGSEGGIDGSNLPFSYVSLPLNNAYALAEEIRQRIWLKLRKKVIVIIVDTDKTYLFGNFHFTPRPKPMKGIHSLGGICSYIIGRFFKFKKRPTPLAIAGCSLQAEEALKIARIADRARGPGSGATVWDMAARFRVEVTGVSWDMLAKIEHKPIVIVRKA